MKATEVYRIYDDVNYEDYNLVQIKKMIESEEIKLIFEGNLLKYNFISQRQLNDDLDDLGYCFWNSSDQKEEVNKIKLLMSEEQNEQLTTIILTVKSYGAPQCFRDVRANISTSGLAQCINEYITHGYEIIALEEFDGDIEAFYSKRLTDDDIDAMAAEMDIPE